MKNERTSWDNYSDLSDEEYDVEKSEIINQAAKQLFLRKYAVSQLEEEVLLKIFRDCKFNDTEIKNKVGSLTSGNTDINHSFKKEKAYHHTKKKLPNPTKQPRYGKTDTQSSCYYYNTGKKSYHKTENWQGNKSKTVKKGIYQSRIVKEKDREDEDKAYDENDIEYYFQAALKHNGKYDCSKNNQKCDNYSSNRDNDIFSKTKILENEERNSPPSNIFSREASNLDTIDETKSEIGESLKGSREGRSISDELKIVIDEVKKSKETIEKMIKEDSVSEPLSSASSEGENINQVREITSVSISIIPAQSINEEKKSNEIEEKVKQASRNSNSSEPENNFLHSYQIPVNNMLNASNYSNYFFSNIISAEAEDASINWMSKSSTSFQFPQYQFDHPPLIPGMIFRYPYPSMLHTMPFSSSHSYTQFGSANEQCYMINSHSQGVMDSTEAK